jgi:hypothetical protein
MMQLVPGRKNRENGIAKGVGRRLRAALVHAEVPFSLVCKTSCINPMHHARWSAPELGSQLNER